MTSRRNNRGWAMKMSVLLLAVALTTGVTLSSGAALAQDKPRCDQYGELLAPETVSGQVVKVDTAARRVAVREADGRIQEFQASQETLQDLKVGDQIEAKLRAGQKC